MSADGFGYVCLGESGARSCVLGHCADGGSQSALADLDVVLGAAPKWGLRGA
jgi:hypothetical protein